MGKYQVASVARPKNWKPLSADDVPIELKGPVEVIFDSDDLFEAVEKAIGHNEGEESRQRMRWAVVVEPGSLGRVWPAARLCTPLTYKVTAIWWPDGWTPHSPLDVPNCVWQAQGKVGGQWMTYADAEATARALNQQCIDSPGTSWYVVVAVENEAVSQSVAYDPSGTETTVEVRKMHVIRPKAGGRGDCACCPAHSMSCTQADWSSLVQTVTAKHDRMIGE